MNFNILALAIPLFLLFIGLEYLITKRKGKEYFHFENTIANLNVGIAERLIDSLTVGFFYFIYVYLYQNFAIFNITPNIWIWIALLLCTDFVWYWYHRLGHEVNLFWAVHIVHHQSEDFNYSVSARITIFQALLRTIFWAILPIIGFTPGMITTILLIHGLYPFFTHTQLVGKLGILEYIFITPSHHRVHHACNEQYLDKNYGDMFIFWDKLFGTFIEEDEKPIYGLTKPLDSHSFAWQHFHYMLEIGYAVSHTEGFINKLKIVFGRPDTVNPNIRKVLEKRFLSPNKIKTQSKRFRYYVIGQMVFTLTLLFFVLFFEEDLSIFLTAVTSSFILITVINCGAILERKGWVFHLEYIRAFLLVATALHFFPNPTLLFIFFILVGAVILRFSNIQRQYLELIYGKA
ncbi:MAG: sterol desaturase family protein [Bacteroidota bacterium]